MAAGYESDIRKVRFIGSTVWKPQELGDDRVEPAEQLVAQSSSRSAASTRRGRLEERGRDGAGGGLDVTGHTAAGTGGGGGANGRERFLAGNGMEDGFVRIHGRRENQDTMAVSHCRQRCAKVGSGAGIGSGSGAGR